MIPDILFVMGFDENGPIELECEVSIHGSNPFEAPEVKLVRVLLGSQEVNPVDYEVTPREILREAMRQRRRELQNYEDQYPGRTRFQGQAYRVSDMAW